MPRTRPLNHQLGVVSLRTPANEMKVEGLTTELVAEKKKILHDWCDQGLETVSDFEVWVGTMFCCGTAQDKSSFLSAFSTNPSFIWFWGSDFKTRQYLLNLSAIFKFN